MPLQSHWQRHRYRRPSQLQRVQLQLPKLHQPQTHALRKHQQPLRHFLPLSACSAEAREQT